MSMDRLIAELGKAGAPALGTLLGTAIGGPAGAAVGSLAGTVLAELAKALDTDPEPDKIADKIASDPAAADKAKEVEARAPAIVRAWEAELARARENDARDAVKGVPWTAAWRPAMAWATCFLWCWALFLHPVMVAATRTAIPAPDMAALTAFTGLFLTLYMGGHTAKEWMAHRAR